MLPLLLIAVIMFLYLNVLTEKIYQRTISMEFLFLVRVTFTLHSYIYIYIYIYIFADFEAAGEGIHQMD